jgi:tetratricopeptide (TPR) repeat protein
MLEECIPALERMRGVQGLRYVQRELAEVDLRAGRAREALARLDPLMQGARVDDNDITFVLPVLAWGYLAAGEGTRAEKVVLDAIDRAQRQGNALSLVTGLRARGLVLAARGEREDADSHFAEAVGLAQQMPHPYAEALAHLDWASEWARRGQTGRARTHLEQVLSIFRRLGAQLVIERTEQALAQIAPE